MSRGLRGLREGGGARLWAGGGVRGSHRPDPHSRALELLGPRATEEGVSEYVVWPCRPYLQGIQLSIPPCRAFSGSRFHPRSERFARTLGPLPQHTLWASQIQRF